MYIRAVGFICRDYFENMTTLSCTRYRYNIFLADILAVTLCPRYQLCEKLTMYVKQETKSIINSTEWDTLLCIHCDYVAQHFCFCCYLAWLEAQSRIGYSLVNCFWCACPCLGYRLGDSVHVCTCEGAREMAGVHIRSEQASINSFGNRPLSMTCSQRTHRNQ